MSVCGLSVKKCCLILGGRWGKGGFEQEHGQHSPASAEDAGTGDMGPFSSSRSGKRWASRVLISPLPLLLFTVKQPCPHSQCLSERAKGTMRCTHRGPVLFSPFITELMYCMNIPSKSERVDLCGSFTRSRCYFSLTTESLCDTFQVCFVEATLAI